MSAEKILNHLKDWLRKAELPKKLDRWLKSSDSIGRVIRDYGLAIFLAIVIAVSIRTFMFEAFRIPTPVMRPTLEPGDVIFVAKWPFGLRYSSDPKPFTEGRVPRYGEVVIFSMPGDPRRNFIKRVVGLPGDAIALQDGRLVFNGTLLDFTPGESEVCGKEAHPKYSYDICLDPPRIQDMDRIIIPEGSVFVIGDLRNGRASRRPWGVVPFNLIRAKALSIWLSVDPEHEGWLPRFRFSRMLTDVR